MNKKLILSGILAVALIFSLAGCGGGAGGGDPGDEYTLEWGSFTTSYSTIMNTIQQQGWDVQQVQGQSAGMAKGATATAIYAYCTSGGIVFNDGGTVTGAFEDLVSYSDDGTTYAPQGLQTLLINNKANAPLAGIFDAGVAAVVFYITKN
jgi:hypothetical protein